MVAPDRAGKTTTGGVEDEEAVNPLHILARTIGPSTIKAGDMHPCQARGPLEPMHGNRHRREANGATSMICLHRIEATAGVEGQTEGTADHTQHKDSKAGQGPMWGIRDYQAVESPKLLHQPGLRCSRVASSRRAKVSPLPSDEILQLGT